MGSATLVDEDIKNGRRAYDALKRADVRARTAFWRFEPESADWRFVVTLPTASLQGPRRSYEQVRRILNQQRIELPLWRITVLSTDDPVARWAQHRIRGASHDVRSSSALADDTLIADTYIYRSAQAALGKS